MEDPGLLEAHYKTPVYEKIMMVGLPIIFIGGLAAMVYSLLIGNPS